MSSNANAAEPGSTAPELADETGGGLPIPTLSSRQKLALLIGAAVCVLLALYLRSESKDGVSLQEVDVTGPVHESDTDSSGDAGEPDQEGEEIEVESGTMDDPMKGDEQLTEEFKNRGVIGDGGTEGE
jgi:hypothetical protein